MQNDERQVSLGNLNPMFCVYISPLTSAQAPPRQPHASLHMKGSYRILRKLKLATWGTRYFPTIGFFPFVPFCLLSQMSVVVQFLLPFFWLFYLTILFQHFPVIYIFCFLFSWFSYSMMIFLPFLSFHSFLFLFLYH